MNILIVFMLCSAREAAENSFLELLCYHSMCTMLAAICEIVPPWVRGVVSDFCCFFLQISLPSCKVNYIRI